MPRRNSAFTHDKANANPRSKKIPPRMGWERVTVPNEILLAVDEGATEVAGVRNDQERRQRQRVIDHPQGNLHLLVTMHTHRHHDPHEDGDDEGKPKVGIDNGLLDI